MSKSYDISVDSDTYFSGGITDRVYYFDWSKLPHTKYKIDWVFQTGSVADLVALLSFGPICVHMDNFCGAYQFQAGQNTCPTHSVFGKLMPNFFADGLGGVMNNDNNTNGSIILDSLPSNPYFTVKLRYGLGTTAPATFGRYFMTMELTPIYDDDSS